MPCSYCHSPLADDARRCLSCAAAVDGSASDQQDGRLRGDKVWNERVKYAFLGDYFGIDSRLREYTDIYGRYRSLADGFAKSLTDSYESSFPNIKEFSVNYPKSLLRIADRVTDRTIEVLRHYHIENVARDTVNELVRHRFDSTGAIVLPVLKAFRGTIRQSGPSKDGAKDKSPAIFAFIDDYAENKDAFDVLIDTLTGEIGTEFLAAFRQTLRDVQLNRRQNALYRSIDVARLSEAIREDVVSMHLVPIEIARGLALPVPYEFSNDRRDKARSIFNDLVSGEVDSYRAKSDIKYMIRLYPFDSRFYKIAISYFPNDRDDVERFAKAMNVSLR